MIELNAKVTKVPQVGPKSQEKLENLNIHSVKDLLYHFPFRYEDRSKIETIGDILKKDHQDQINRQVTIEATLTDLENIYTRTRKRITKGKAQDETGEIQLIWFNMHYLKRSLRVGETYLMTGKIGTFGREISLIVPQMEKTRTKNLHSGRIVPIYPQTEGISSRWLRARINDVIAEIEKQEGIQDFLPTKLREKYNHLPLWKSLKQIHFPDNFELLKQARARLGYDELFIELAKVEKLKEKWENEQEAVKLEFEQSIVDRFIEKLPFELTPDQKKAVEEVLKDLKKDIPMNRLLEGDVGTGKTIVAIIASLTNIHSNKNVLYMAPTEILAEQHYKTYKKFLNKGLLRKYESGIELRTGSNKDEILSGVKNKIIIGTHALLYKKEKYENVGLVIIDEQHRFGVEQREELLKFNKDKTTPHLLTMTATPIPRTLALTIYGDLEISTLKEKPNKKAKITTKVVPNTKRSKVFQWIAAQNEPTFIVCPFIEESEAEIFSQVKAATQEYENLKEGFFKDRKVGLLHGRLSSEEKSDIVKKFENRKINVLVSTPVIEVGIDIPDATIMVIESAERYGLASLHQLRGRIGRGEKEGYCFVFMSEPDEKGKTIISKKALRRLKYLEKTDSGLELAEIDLKLRGPGEFMGIKQHGFENFRLADLRNTDLIEKIRKDVKMFAV